jgi:nitroimidazol reductase NimA-like FMN-containing flavoprotein (pyridoxamine 5'-phosphate oxidase superfamily)
MFREMRRGKQLMSAADTKAAMDRCMNGILSCAGDEGYPYGVPVSYVYHDEKIYFHCAKTGHKIDAIARDPKVCVTVGDEDQNVSAEYTSYFRSVIAFGRARIVEGDERFEAFMAMIEKYSGDRPPEEKRQKAMDCEASLIVAIDVDHIIGKEAIEFVRAKQ